MNSKKSKEISALIAVAIVIIVLLAGYSDGRSDKHEAQQKAIEASE